VSAAEGARRRCAKRTHVQTVRIVRVRAAEERAAGGAELRGALAEAALARPKVRTHCEKSERPCPFVACRFHLFCDVTPAGGLRFNFPGREVDEIPETCALDVADRGPVTLEEVGRVLNLTRERVRQLETMALERFREAAAAQRL
jgi:hypothetical protein